MKYNKMSVFEKPQRNYKTFVEIDSKNWSNEFKETAKSVYSEFAQHGLEFSTHGIARYLDRVAQYVEITKEKVLQVHKQVANYKQKDGKQVKYYDEIALVYSNSTPEIITIIKWNGVGTDWIEIDG